MDTIDHDEIHVSIEIVHSGTVAVAHAAPNGRRQRSFCTAM